ncbi:transcriptional regulator, LacI family [Gluconacetobacter diazotrophicus PA1 5]|uniref:LacI family DNA-binding transcriptional regulator n=1 Tax=Gluconacetobacter diazotrophicus TaxID=33996 RepID=UPI000173D078|nr:LacI family DNA-binding transcriptional regulator [Gluconacetobacter diazotrophicus]ACI51099.1 transcriptional regulator, LacI family [Gluconacetobacter diazotrophicus PA1 5]TWB07626.1 LacI family transcriptional regulator [Gluconacetobacter diazotrophicus]
MPEHAISEARPRAARPTIMDVSARAGVSRMTVSRALRTPDLVREDTRRAIERAIADLGYVPDRAAEALSTRRSGFVGLVVPTLTNTNFADAARGLTDIIRRDGYELLIGYTDYDENAMLRHVRDMLGRRAEALILPAGPRGPALRGMLASETIPIVQMAGLAGRPVHRMVGYSNREAGRMAAHHLIALGHTRIGALGAEGDGLSCDHRGGERLAGFAEALREAGLSDALVLRMGNPPISFTHGAQAMGHLLDREPDVQAVFAVSDLVGVGALMECHRRGVRVPQDISLIGFGGFEVGRQMVPALTTVAVDFRAMGERTGRMVLDLLAGRPGVPRIVDLGVALVERETTAFRPSALSITA